ncbi:MAG TPA: NAD(P)-dependent oxidoreductase [Caulobacteraceae bacterium]|jgi:phosphoglycerate dehydrogenase-like enzyme|nr:NAD(P)-dependent oxidoreductase [Caulobacteraceae bacterium]
MRLIVYEAAYRRVADQLAIHGDLLDLLVVGADGVIRHGDKVVSEDDAQPDAGWMSADGMGTRAMPVALLKSRNLTWVQSGAAGVDHPIWGQLIAKGAVLTTGHGQAISIAEFILGEVLGHFQRLAERRAEQAAHRWTRLPFREIAGTRWTIVGFGAIGQATAERARAFGAHITGVRRSGVAHALADRMGKLADAKAMVADADVVVLAAPLNSETANMADAAFFAGMKPGSVLVNVGRGGLVDEAALLAALDAGAPGFAVLDVFHAEPQPADGPFWDHPKVAMAPHASAFGSGQAARNDAIFVENLRRRLAGEPVLYEADARDLG